VQHIVLFRFVDGTSDAQIEALAAGLSGLPAQIPELRSYRHGRDIGVADTSWDYGLVAELDSVEDWRTYREHPVHVALIRDLITPITAERAAVQLELG
jgi:hypothetical protein